MASKKCEVCQKTAYPLESLTVQDKTYHKLCFKCSVCAMTLNLKNGKSYEGKVYCATHTPKPTAGPIGLDAVSMKSATSVPKKGVVSGVHKADPKVAPQQSSDFTVNEAKDQSTENQPEESGIQYDQHGADQSTENQPSESDVQYDQYNADQSTETYDDQQYEQ